MSIDAAVTNYIIFTGDQQQEITLNSGELADSPLLQQPVNLGSGNNEFPVPDIEGTTVHGVVIVPPALNEVEPTLKGANTADTGILLSATQVSILQFGSVLPTSINLDVDEEVSGFRLIWF